MTLKEFKEKADWLEEDLKLLQKEEDICMETGIENPSLNARYLESLRWQKILGDFAAQNNLVTWRENGVRIVKAIPLKIF